MSLRHIKIHEMTEDEAHIVDQLIRAIEYFEDIRYYQLKLRKGLVSSEATIRKLKLELREVSLREPVFPDTFYDIEKEAED